MHSDAICNGLNIARHLIKGAFPLIVVAIVSPTIYAADLLVPSQFQTIQAAIDNAQNGDTVRIAPGLYSERVSIIGKAISVQSNDGARSVTIDAAGTGRCVDVSGVTEGQLRLQGLILQHGSANDFGGGIRVTGSRISLKNCEIYSNRAFQDIGCAWCTGNRVRGGGMAIVAGSSAIVEQTDFRGNTVHIAFWAWGANGQSRGGGLYIESSTTRVIGGSFANNEASADDHPPNCANCNHPTTAAGAGICVGEGGNLEASGVSIYGSRIHGDNISLGIGAGISVLGGTANLTNCNVSDSQSNVPDNCFCGPEHSLGGGAYVDAAGVLVMQNCTISHNIVVGSDNLGGAIYNAGGRVEVGGTSLCENSTPAISGSWDDRGGNTISATCESSTSVKFVGPADINPSACAAIGDLLTFDVVVNNPPLTLVAGQFAINYDKMVLEYVSVEGGDSPITSIPLVLPDAQAGKLFWVSSVQGGGTGTAATTRVARVTFRAIANDCDGNSQISFDPGFAPILTANGNGAGASLPTTDPAPVMIDTIGPVITNVPADLVMAADAGAGCLAVREIGTPTVTDSCSTAALTWSRSDGAVLLAAPWLCGTTVVTWTATDACGRTSTATTSVTVNSYHLMNVTVAYAGTDYASSMTRCIGFRVDDVTLTDVMTFMSGTATATLQLPIGNYNCATADDDLHSLVSQVPVSINGTNYQMTVTGESALINGDLDDDNVVNVVDWGVLVVRVGMAAAVNTDCTTVGFHADFDGDGTVTNADGNRLLQSFLVQGDTGCNAFNANGGPVVTRISVADLSVIAGMNASAADMNRDGVVDAKDIAMWTRLQSMPGRQPLTAKGISSRN
jgi:hypothetical protein